MIIFILILAAIAFIYFNVIPGKAHNLLAWISLLFLGLSVIGIVEHDYNHWGMKTETVTTKKILVSSVNPQLPILLYQPLGDGTEKVYLYKTDNQQKKPQAIKLNKMKAQVKTTTASPTVTIKTTRYVYKGNFTSLMFGIFGHNHELKQRSYTFSIPSNWQTMSVKQLKKLQKQMQQQLKLQKQMQMKNSAQNQRQ